MSLNKVYFFQNFLTPQECQDLNDWADMALSEGWAGNGVNIFNIEQPLETRKTTRGYEDLFDFPSFAQTISEKITARLNLHSMEKSSVGKGLGIVCTLTLPGGSLPVHRDPLEDNGTLHQFSCNILTRSSESGGVLSLDGQSIPMNAGDLICYSPSYIKHSLSEVGGNVSRVMWLFRYQLLTDFSGLSIE